MDKRDFDDRRRLASELVDELEGLLPDRAIGKEIARKSKLPFKVALLAGTLAWRIHELARAALTAYDQQNHVAGILIARAIMETVAVLCTLHDRVNAYEGGDVNGLDDCLMRGIFAARNRNDRPLATNVLSDIDRVSKHATAFRWLYDELSEYAHPNDSGTASAFARVDRSGQIATFTSLGEDPGKRAWTLIESLTTTLILAVPLYGSLCERLPAFARICDSDVEDL